MYDSVLTQENTVQRKPVFWHNLRSVKLMHKAMSQNCEFLKRNLENRSNKNNKISYHICFTRHSFFPPYNLF